MMSVETLFGGILAGRVVAIITDGHPFSGVELIRGVASYAQRHGPWRLVLRTRDDVHFIDELSSMHVDGVVARPKTREMAKALAATGIAAINVLGEAQHPNLPSLMPNDEKIGQAAAEFLRRKGFNQFAYCGTDAPFSREREQGFADALARTKFPCNVLVRPDDPKSRYTFEELFQGKILTRWVSTLARPTAVFACNDQVGVAVTEACDIRGLRVPDDIAVLGVDNSELRCEYARTPLSSIDPGLHELGVAAARMLDGLMKGRKPPSAPQLIDAHRIIERQSTNVLACDDEEVKAAVRYIHENADRHITVEDVVSHVGVSRRALERRFQKALRRSPGEDLRLVRVERAQKLLVDTNLSLTQIAVRCGFESLSRFSKSFKLEFGDSPSRFRAAREP